MYVHLLAFNKHWNTSLSTDTARKPRARTHKAHKTDWPDQSARLAITITWRTCYCELLSADYGLVCLRTVIRRFFANPMTGTLCGRGPPWIKTTVTVQLQTRSIHGLVVAVHLRTRTVRESDARRCGYADTLILHTTGQAPCRTAQCIG